MKLSITRQHYISRGVSATAAGTFVYLLFFGVLAVAQNGSPFIEPHVKPDRPPSIRVNSDLVVIPVTVLDPSHQPVIGIEKERFKLYEDRVEQSITHFAMEDAPISIGFVVDTSASMRDKLQKARDAVATILKTANPGDEFFLVKFNQQVEIPVDLTPSPDAVQKRLIFLEAYGRTALLDAIRFSVQRVSTANNARKALIIISDGGDNSSRYTIAELEKLVREADTQIYIIGIFDRSQVPEERAGPALLRRFTKQSGGRFFEIKEFAQLPDIALKISEALRNQYVLGYMPREVPHDGKYHRVEVKLAQPQGSPKMQASWRRGYRAPVE